VRDAMTPIAEAKTVRPGTGAYEALARMMQTGVGRLLVVDTHGEIVGILTRSDLLHLIRLRTELGTDLPA
jgi:predicted transcriptional regulator